MKTFKAETAMCDSCSTIYAEADANGKTNACPDCGVDSRICRDWMFNEIQWKSNDVMAAASYVAKLTTFFNDGARWINTRKMKAAVRANEVVLDDGLTIPDVIAAICAMEE